MKIGRTATTSMSVAYTIALRTSRDASRMTLAVDLPPPSLRCWRRRRTTFSMSMIASSTMSPSAITNPARTIVLIVTPRHDRTRPAAISESGMAVMLISAVRHSKRNAPSMRIMSSAPRIIAPPRLSMAFSMNVAGRKIVESISIPGRPGRSSSSAASSPAVTSAVFAHGSFWTTSRRPGPSSMTASPMSGGVSMTTSATSFRRITVPSRSATGTSARSLGVRIGRA